VLPKELSSWLRLTLEDAGILVQPTHLEFDQTLGTNIHLLKAAAWNTPPSPAQGTFANGNYPAFPQLEDSAFPLICGEAAL
jgi:hypothetical protein